ncbi:CHAD domain-containing protein [Actinomadura sp. HBU206391]|uniref:CYTH and CHAD domain-containing protein n=1 Tax=Actinomadura sp. HBU206391 TaxID=2731692 RepID=UPI00164F542E|nr:CYTH and CHAD domain-containing protein [Actinomadura sp. HBU206391]MBC6458651.1 CYTH and CHAD domain-containing protein [Actinomadura sp. HBU206391]
MTDHVEIERKYDAEAGFVVPDLNGLPGVHAVGEPQAHVLVAKYFDTRDFRLAARGITLRRRRGGEDAGWHLKIPAGKDAKRELRAPLGSDQAVPARLADLVSAHTRGEPLRPVAILETNRTVIRLLGQDGEVLAEVADDAVAGQVIVEPGDDDRAPSGGAWREIEVELAAGSAELLKAAGKRMRKAGASKASSGSKLGRVLEPVMARTREERPPAATPPAGTAGAAVMAYLTAQFDALLAYDPKARMAEHDAVHKMRVSVRRIRSALKSYRPVLDREHTDPLQPELKWLADELGTVRDLEVLRERFTGLLDALPGDLAGHSGWLRALHDQETTGYRTLNTALREPRYFRLLDALDDLLAHPPLTGRAEREATEELPRIVRRTWRRLERAYGEIESAPPEDRDTARHETRKEAKRARYSAEVAAGVLGKPATAVAANAEAMQEVMGRFQDGVIAQEHLARIAAASTDPRETFTLGVLYQVEREEARAALDDVAATWAKARDPAALAALRR